MARKFVNFLHVFKYVVLFFICISLISIVSLRFLNPPFTSFIISESNFFKKKYSHEWIPLDKVGKNILLAMVTTEDARFCSHIGFDLTELYKVYVENEKRGASTISQQVVKNLLLTNEISLEYEFPLFFGLISLKSLHLPLKVYF